jgi:hypothetical protein
MNKTAPGMTVPHVQLLWLGILPKRECDAPAALAMVAYWPRRNHAADVAHRKRRRALLNDLKCSLAVVLRAALLRFEPNTSFNPTTQKLRFWVPSLRSAAG